MTVLAWNCAHAFLAYVLQELLRRIATWLNPGGILFVHMFCHKLHPYHFEVTNPSKMGCNDDPVDRLCHGVDVSE